MYVKTLTYYTIIILSLQHIKLSPLFNVYTAIIYLSIDIYIQLIYILLNLSADVISFL